ncbi:MAG: type II secretion system secretin GspD [bacterium]|nr:type II secretion system secretin GspD [bacterium]
MGSRFLMRWRLQHRVRLYGLALILLFVAGPTLAQAPPAPEAGLKADNGHVQLDFTDVELSVVIDTIARLTNKNFIYDDRVRGRVTIVSPTKVTREEAYAVFESVLQVKGFTTVETPGGAIKVIPIREAKESNIEIVRGKTSTPKSDRFVTRLIALRFIDAEAITNTLKPLVSKDASMVAYPPTNTVILTDSASNIRRILSILQSIDVESYKEELTVIQVRHADSATLASQLSEIFDADVASTTNQPVRARARRAVQQAAGAATQGAPKGRVRLITDERTNSLIVLASRPRMTEIREVIQRLDVPVVGGGRIHVYRLRHADAEELATTLSSLISGQPAGGGGGGRAVVGGVAANPALRAAITELSEGVTVTADAPTNSLVIQATREGYDTLSQVIRQLDIERPQVLVEALIMEVDVTDGRDLGFNGFGRIFRGNTSYALGSVTDSGAIPDVFGSSSTDSEGTTSGTSPGGLSNSIVSSLFAAATRSSLAPIMVPGVDEMGNEILEAATDAFGNQLLTGSLIQGIIRASASLSSSNILSAPHILTLDNEEAEIKIGNNIPIVTSRVESAAGQSTGSLATSQNIERHDIGITLRVTPQISEGDSLRLKIFQEITAINPGLTAQTGTAEEVGVALSNRKIENVVVVGDGETIVIGGLIGEDEGDIETKVPWLGDIPILGWLFKTTDEDVQKLNLLVFLTPYIVRNEAELATETIRKREEFWESSEKALRLTDKEKKQAKERREEAEAAGISMEPFRGRNPVRGRLVDHRNRYPVDQMREIERQQNEAREQAAAPASVDASTRYGVLAATFGDEGAAAAALQQLIDAGYDGTLVSGERSGTVLYQVRIGPFDEQQEAEAAAKVMREGFELSPVVTVENGG